MLHLLVHYTNSRVTQEAMDTGTYDATRPPMVVTSEGMRVLRPEEVDMETQTVRLISNEQPRHASVAKFTGCKRCSA